MPNILPIVMVIVVLVALFDLGSFLFKELFSKPFGFFSSTLIEIFGLFLNILIALEINVLQVELVMVTSLIAVARKIIILDFEKTSGSI